MRLTVVLVLPLFAFSAGCQHLSLRNHTERQARTLTGLQYHQVLDNIALFIQNPNALPFFSVASTGTTSNNFSANPGSGFNWDLLNFNNGPPLFFFDKANVTLAGTFTTNEGWNTLSAVNPDALLLMRCVYQKVVGYPACSCDCEKKLQAYFEERPCYLEAMHPGWYGVGRRCDVPKHAVCVGRCGLTYVWVTADGIDPLTRLTLAILDLATVAPGIVIPEPQANRTKQLTDTAKDLALILSQYPQPYGPGFQELKKVLDATLAALAVAHQNKPADEIHRVNPEMKEHALRLLTPADTSSAAPPVTAPNQLLFRPRMNLYIPFQATPGPPFLPGR